MTKLIAKNNGDTVFEALLSVTNEYEEIKALFLSPGTSLELAKPMLKEMNRNLTALGLPPPLALYTDKCCNDKHQVEECIPSLKNNVVPIVKKKLPEAKLIDDTEVLYITTVDMSESNLVTVTTG